MTEQPRATTAVDESESIRRFRGEGWLNLWGVVLLLFLGCVGVCVYLIASAGLQGAVEGRLFGSAALLGLVLGVWLIGRWTVPSLLTKSGSIDPRNANLMRSPRTAWYLWGRHGR